ncbi:hypothetical protein QC763_0023440 [Podospora pseudopauciseta]|uniref:Uncharacterized protein n=2 Tax=Podospora TaxID=5144 RepID=A0ABR0I2I5_9PEZI|nr:hypothetical protein QC763_0023440 [Podospora pseudopauciseta]KAK4682846.1 hypothetical protein QC764_0023370 [Podospora pseudoanserina]
MGSDLEAPPTSSNRWQAWVISSLIILFFFAAVVITFNICGNPCHKQIDSIELRNLPQLRPPPAPIQDPDFE